MQISWYSDSRGPSFLQTTEPIPTKVYDQWEPFRFDVQAPADAVAIQAFLRLVPPTQGVDTLDLDNLRVIEWSRSNTNYNPFYNYALLTGKGDLTFTEQVLPGAEQWLSSSAGDQPK